MCGLDIDVDPAKSATTPPTLPMLLLLLIVLLLLLIVNALFSRSATETEKSLDILDIRFVVF